MTGSADDRRRTVLDKIRAGTAGDGTTATRQAAVDARLARQESHLVPARAKRDAHGLRQLFIEQLRAQSATVLEAKSAEDVPSLIAGYLRGLNQPMRLRMGEDRRLAALPWVREPQLALEKGRAQPADEASLSHAMAGVAETGTLVLASGPDNPVTLNYMPESHVVMLNAADISGAYEQAFAKARAHFGKGEMPRTLNFISGPSRTADIGGRPVLGAHGPRRLCVVIVDGA